MVAMCEEIGSFTYGTYTNVVLRHITSHTRRIYQPCPMRYHACFQSRSPSIYYLRWAQRKHIIHANGEALTNDSILECLKAGPSHHPKPTRKQVLKKGVRGTKNSRARTTEAQELSGDSIEVKDTEHCFQLWKSLCGW